METCRWYDSILRCALQELPQQPIGADFDFIGVVLHVSGSQGAALERNC